MTLEQIFSAAKCRAVIQSPLESALILHTSMELNSTLDGIAATSDRSLVITINPDFIAEFKDETKINIICHEIMHAVEMSLIKP